MLNFFVVYRVIYSRETVSERSYEEICTNSAFYGKSVYTVIYLRAILSRSALFEKLKKHIEKLVFSQISGDPSLSCGPVKDGYIKTSTRSPADFSTTTGTRVTVFDSNRVQESQFFRFFEKSKI